MKKIISMSAVIFLLSAMAFAAVPAAWRLAGNMPNQRQMHTACYNTTDTVLYVLGGNVANPLPQDDAAYANDSLGVLYFKIDTSTPVPSVSEWGWGPTLPSNWAPDCGSGREAVAVYNSDGAFIYNGRLYITPGNTNGANAWGINEILMTDISTTGGLLGTWSVTDNPPAPSGAGYVVFDAGWEVYNNRVYRAAGREALEACTGGGSTYVTSVVSAPINPDGSIGTWRNEASLPADSRWGMLEIVNDLAIFIAGWNSSLGSVDTVYVGQVGAGGAISSWSTSANPFPTVVYMNSGCDDGDYVYVLTGREAGGLGIANSYRAKVNTLGTDIEAWETVASVPYKNKYCGAAGGGGVYILTGGRNQDMASGPITDDLFVLSNAPVMVGNKPALGNWTPADGLVMTSLPDSDSFPDNHLIFHAAMTTTPSESLDYKLLINGAKGWGGGNEVGNSTGGNLYFVPDSTFTAFYFDQRDVSGDNWAPATNSVGNDIGYTWVAVGEFQDEAGETSDWKPDSTVTVMHDDGLNGDASAGDGIYTFEFGIGVGVSLSSAQWKVVRQGGWSDSIKFGANGWSHDPGDSSNATITAPEYNTITLEFDAWYGHLRSTITPYPSVVEDWELY